MVQAVRRRLVGQGTDQPFASHLVVPLTVAVWPEGEQWVAQCVEFDVASSGASSEEAAAEAMDAICSYLNTLEELGERERVFAERGIRAFFDSPPTVQAAPLPRALAEREGLQVRLFEYPMSAASA